MTKSKSKLMKVLDVFALVFFVGLLSLMVCGYANNIIELITDDTMKVPEFTVRFLGIFCIPLGAVAGYF